MSVLKSCPYCGGHGYINQFENIEGGCRAWSKTCIACNGTGTMLCQETNADRIRAMSDEEMAVFLCAVKFRRETILNVPDFLYIKDAYDWLQQPEEEDT